MPPRLCAISPSASPFLRWCAALLSRVRDKYRLPVHFHVNNVMGYRNIQKVHPPSPACWSCGTQNVQKPARGVRTRRWQAGMADKRDPPLRGRRGGWQPGTAADAPDLRMRACPGARAPPSAPFARGCSTRRRNVNPPALLPQSRVCVHGHGLLSITFLTAPTREFARAPALPDLLSSPLASPSSQRWTCPAGPRGGSSYGNRINKMTKGGGTPRGTRQGVDVSHCRVARTEAR